MSSDSYRARMRATYNVFEKKRRPVTRLFLVVCLIFATVTHHSWSPDGPVDRLFDWCGAALAVLGVLGRLWSTMYVGGRKNKDLITTGPYSLCRNPLYLFSFIAGLGVCVEFENLILIGLYIVFFYAYYSRVIKSEEGRLELLFGAKFAAFKGSTPAFIPNIFRLNLGEFPEISGRPLFKNALDGSVFLLLVGAAYVIEMLQESGVIPVLWNIP